MQIAKTLSALVVSSALMFSPVLGTTISLQPSPQTATLGNSVDLMLQIEGLGAGTAPSLGAFDLVINYTPSILSFDSVTFGADLGPVFGSWSDWSNDPSLGILTLSDISLDSAFDLDSLQPGDFLMASLRFSAIGVGTSAVDITDPILADGNGDPLIPDALLGANITVVDSQAVPESGPMASGFILVVFAMLGAHWFQKSRRVTM